MFLWSRLLILSIIAVFLSLSFVVASLPVNLLFVFSIVFVECVKKDRLVVIGILGYGILIDVLSGNIIGLTSVFLFGLYLLFRYIGTQYINLGKNFDLIVKVLLASFLYILTIWFANTMLYYIFNINTSRIILTSLNYIHIIFSIIYSIIALYIYKFLIKLILRKEYRG